MYAYPIPSDEQRRLEQLPGYGIVGTAPEPAYDAVTAVAARLFRAPISLISVVTADAQHLKSRHGLACEATPREWSFCTHVIAAREPMVVPDALADDRFRDNPLVVGEPGIRFYAGVPIVNDVGVALGALCVIDREPRAAPDPGDLHALQQLAAALSAKLDQRRDMRLRAAVAGFAHSSSVALVTTDADGRITFWNPAAEAIFGYARDDVVGQDIGIIVPGRFRSNHERGLANARAGHRPRLAGKSVEVLGLRRDGSEVPIEIALSAWRGVDGMEFGAQIQDISARHARDRRLHHLATHDPLTGLRNRRELTEALETAIAAGTPVALIAIDLDAFKQVNDTLGHPVGDDLLRVVAVRLSARLCPGSLLARMGGDEFAVLLPDCPAPEQAAGAAAALVRAFVEPFRVGEHLLTLGASAGVALAPRDAADPEELMVRADLALLEAKRAGAGRTRLFDDAIEHQLVLGRRLKEEVRDATLRQEWLLYYQPQVDMVTGRQCGAEALLRWQHPEHGLLPPAAFLETLESHSVAEQVGRWILDEACGQLRRWRAGGRQVPGVSVNLFAVQLRVGGIAAAVTEALARHGLAPHDLELEFTENIVLQRDLIGLEELRTLRQAGVRIAFDDFGTGFASLKTLRDFPVDKLKIDRSFVRGLPEDVHSRAIIGGIVHLATELGLALVVEGVETAAQKQALLALGCRIGQGYLWGRPHPLGLPATAAAPRTVRPASAA